MRYEFWLGVRYLFAKRRERFISIIALLSIGGVTLGVAALITVLAVMSGFDYDIKDKLVGTNAHLIVDAPGGVRDIDETLRRLTAIEHVIGVSPFISGQAIVRMPQQAFGVLLRGIDVERESRVNRMGEYMVAGRLPREDDEVAIGTELAASIGAGVGAPLKLISPADGTLHELKVSGLFRSGMFEYDSNLIAVTIPLAQELYHLRGTVSGIGIKLDRLDRSDEMKGQVEQAIGPGYAVKTWTELNPALFGALRVEKTVMFVILTLIIVVAALNIMSMLIMIVMEKTKDIGILRALGATRASIATLFLSQGCLIGFIGVCLGLAGTYAAIRAARLSPVDALRYE